MRKKYVKTTKGVDSPQNIVCTVGSSTTCMIGMEAWGKQQKWNTMP